MASGSTYVFLAMLLVVGSLICNTKEVSGQCGGRGLNERDLVQSLNVFGWRMMV